MPPRSLLFFLLLTLVIQADGAELPMSRLTLSYSVDAGTCKKAAELLRTDPLCRADDNYCDSADDSGPGMESKDSLDTAFERIADNEYGFTTISKSKVASLPNSTVIHLSIFGGDRHPRKLETWQVETARLAAVLAIPPGPIPYELRTDKGIIDSDQLLAAEFSVLLKEGKRISGEWSPILEIDDHPYAVVRACSGKWIFGGYYACLKVNSVTLLRLSETNVPRLYCRFSRGKGIVSTVPVPKLSRIDRAAREKNASK